MKTIKTFKSFINENYRIDEKSVKVPKELVDAVGETSEMYPEDFDSATEKKIIAAQKKYKHVIDDYAASDMLDMTIADVKKVLTKNSIKFEEITHNEGTILMF